MDSLFGEVEEQEEKNRGRLQKQGCGIQSGKNN
jgi:hypothetical protein